MRENLISVFWDTQELLQNNERLRWMTRQAIASTRVYPERFENTRLMGTMPTMVTVMEETTLNAARQLARQYHRIAILNFANAVHPGGGVVNGAVAQEESLCRSSNLYPCLTKPEVYDNFYMYNHSRDGYYSDRLIYTENVTVFKTDDRIPVYTDDWFCVDVITCPAPNLNCLPRLDVHRLRKIFENRIRNIFAVAESYGVEALVLGAFGCGAFRNPPELVAKAFEHQIYEGDYKNTFREIVFAIGTFNERDQENLHVFRAILAPWQNNPLYGRKISVLGDSISTYWGSNPAGHRVFYDADQCLKMGMYSVEDTWWMQVIRYFGGHLLVNNSYSGSRVSGCSRYSGNSDLRTYGLHSSCDSPEIILVFMGLNDFADGVPVERPEDKNIEVDDYDQYFSASYDVMLWKLQAAYPEAEIYCATLPPSKFGDGRRDRFPYHYGGIHLDAYNRAIRSSARQHGCRIIDLRKLQIHYDSVDGLHPSVTGMQQLAQGWIETIGREKQGTVPVNDDDFKEGVQSASTGRLLGSAACMIIAIIMLALMAIGCNEGWLTNTVLVCVLMPVLGLSVAAGVWTGFGYFRGNSRNNRLSYIERY